MPEIYTVNFTEINLPGGVLYPDSYAIGTYNTAWLSMANHQRATFLLLVGDMAAAATLDVAIQQATTAAGAGAKALTPAKAITQLTQAGGDGDDPIAIEVRTEELDVNGGFDHIRAVVTVAGNAVEFSLLPLRHVPNYPPVGITGWTEVVL